MQISEFLSENFQILVVKISIYLHRRVFVMRRKTYTQIGGQNSDYMWAETSENVPSDMRAQRKCRSACVSAQSDQKIHWQILNSQGWESFFMQTTKILARLRGCAGWSESSLCAQVRSYVFSCSGPCYLFGDHKNAYLCEWWTNVQIVWREWAIVLKKNMQYRFEHFLEGKSNLTNYLYNEQFSN